MTDVASSLFAKFDILHAHNLWWTESAQTFAALPEFRRDVFDDLYADVRQLPQMVSVTGPPRVGKSTLLQQCIQQLTKDAPDPEAQARRIVYFSMQAPGLEIPGFNQEKFFNELVAAAVQASKGGQTYSFLDEIQRFPRWELYSKKFYDLKTPVRFVVSGSASAPIFKKSRESLLGRLKNFHVLPFSLREWWSCPETGNLSPSGEPANSIDKVLAKAGRMFQSADATRSLGGSRNVGCKLTAAVYFLPISCQISRYLPAKSPKTIPSLRPIFAQTPSAARAPRLIEYLNNSHELAQYRDKVEHVLFEGGFPEVWSLPTLLAKQEYPYQNQVEHVFFEDLMVAAELRKPEMLRRFYLGLLKDSGRESNLTQISSEIGLARSTIETYFPPLEATDLVWRLHKHTSTKSTPKAGNFKTYLVDLAVRNAVMKLSQ